MSNFPPSEIQHGHEQYDEKKILEDHDALLSLFLKLFLAMPVDRDVMGSTVVRDRSHYTGEQPTNPFAIGEPWLVVTFIYSAAQPLRNSQDSAQP